MTGDSTESKASSTTETAIEPSDAPVAIESPKSVLTKQTTHGGNSPAVVVVERVGPLLLVLTFTCGILVCAVGLMLVFGPAHMEARTQAAVAESIAQAETRIRAETAQDTAEAKATAHVARTQALVAVDKVEDLRVKLAPNVVLDGH